MDFLSKKFTTKLVESAQRKNAKGERDLVTSVKKVFRAFCVFLGVFAVKPVIAQNDVQVIISVLPPYSAYLQDYAGAGTQVQVFVRNTTTTRLQVRLQGSVTGDNGVVIQTVPNYRPPVPLTLEPLQNRLLSYADLSGLFDLGQLDVQGVDRANLYKGLPLPEGSYQLCIRAFDNATSRPLSPENPLGCSPPFQVKSVEPPILIAPLCDSDVQVLTPQNLIFTWTPTIGVSPAMVDYTLQIVELPLETADPNVFIDAVVLPKSGVEVKGLKTSTFLYSVVQPQLISGKKYAWRVQARDVSGRTNFLNDGKSPVCAFQYGPHVSIGLDSVKTPIVVQNKKSSNAVLVACNSLTYTNPAALTAGNGSGMSLSWNPNPTFRKVLAQKMGYGTDSASVRGAIQTAGGTYKLTVFDKGGGNVIWTPEPTPKEFVSGDPDQLGFPLEYSKVYDYHVELLLPDKVKQTLGDELKSWPLTSKTCSFSIKKKVSAGFIVRGQIRYRFTGDGMTGDYPANNTDVKISFTSQAASGLSITGGIPTADPLGVGSLVAQTGARGIGGGRALTPQEKLAAIGGGQVRQKAAPKGQLTASSRPALGLPPGELPNTYYGKTDANGIYEIPIPWDDLPALLKAGTFAGQDTIKSERKSGPNGRDSVVIVQKVPLTALNYTLNLPGGYYQNTGEVRSLTYTPGSTRVAVGVAKVNAYAYTAKIIVTKDYNSFYILAKDGKPVQVQKGYEKKTSMEQTINQAVDGIVIDVYRKGKDAGIPAIEGAIDNGAVVAQQAELNKATSGLVLVATGKTKLETGNGGQPQGYVIFDRLLCNANPGDEYYVSARPDPAKGIATAKQVINIYNKKATGDYTTDTDATFAAPEDTLFFEAPMPTASNGVKKGQAYFSRTADYKLRSLLPPVSRLSGRMLYSWPDQPERFVMANMPFVVKVGYAVNHNFHNTSNGYATGQKIKQTWYSFSNVEYIGDDGKPHELSTDDKDVVMGTGKTDKNGNFSLDVVNLNYKGTITATGNVTSNDIEFDDPVAGGKRVDPKGSIGKQSDKVVAVTDPDFDGTGQFSFKTLGEVNMDKNVSGQTNSSSGTWQGAHQAAAVDVVKAFDGGTSKATQKAGQKATQKAAAKSGGPYDDENLRQEFFPDEIIPATITTTDGKTLISTITRYYYFELQEGADFYVTAPVANTVLVNAFGSLDMGEIVHTVRQYTGPLRIVHEVPQTGPYGAKKAPLLVAEPQARVIIFREDSKGMKQLPEKEGYAKKRFAPLPKASGNDKTKGFDPGDKAVEYYAEGRADTAGVITDWETGKAPNLLIAGNYYYYVLPKEGATSYFLARVVTMQTNYWGESDITRTEEKGNYYDNIKVSPGPSRLLVQLVDKTNKGKSLQGTIWLYGYNEKTKQSSVLYKKDGTKADVLNLATPASGYYELPVGDYFAKGEGSKRFYLMADVPGYRPEKGTGPLELTTEQLSATGSQYDLKLFFVPGATVTGVVKGPEVTAKDGGYVETGKTVGIPSYIRRMADSAVISSAQDGSFKVAVSTNGPQKLIIEPVDIGYWADTITLTDLVDGKNKALTDPILVSRIKHRLRFIVQGSVSGQAAAPAASVWVTINGDLNKKKKTGANGVVEIEFENVSVNNYTVKVAGQSDSDWIPQLFEIKNKESKTWTEYRITLKAGGRISGIVTLDKQPVAGAKVYLDYAQSLSEAKPESVSAGNTSGDNTGETLISTYSGGQNLGSTIGVFSLDGIPLTDGMVKIRATLADEKGGSTVVGAVATVTMKNGIGTATLNLTTYAGMIVQSAYGFPLTVEKLEAKPDGTVNVTGQLDLRKNRSGFTWLPTGDVVRLRDVVFKPTDSGGVKVGTPALDNVPLDNVTELKFRYAGKYNVLVRHPDAKTGQVPKALTLSRNSAGKGVMAGKVQVVDNSFNYPSTYLSFANKGDENFFLANSATSTTETVPVLIGGKAQQQKVTNTVVDSRIEVLTALSTDAAFDKKASTPSTPDAATYYLSDEQGGSIKFSLIEFPTVANPAGSYIDPGDGKIHLAVDLRCHIDNMQPADFTVHIDELILDDKQVYPKKGSNPLELKFEDWTLQVRDWTIDPQEGGIVKKGPIVIAGKSQQASSSANDPILMKTGAADIAFGNFVLRHNLFLLEGPRLSSLPIGDGLATLAVQNPQDAFFGYDTGFDGVGHWKLGAFGKGTSPAGILTVATPPETATLLVASNAAGKGPVNINFDYIQLLSNNVNILTVSQNQTFRVQNNSLTEFTPGGFTSGKGFLSLKGSFRLLGAPRAAGLEMSIDYAKAGTAIKGTYSAITAPWVVEIKGHTKFMATLGQPNLSITATDVVINGTAQEEGASPKLNTLFCARSGSYTPYWLHVIPQSVKKFGGKYTLDVLGTVGARVKKDATDWDGPLTFVGELYDGAQLHKAASPDTAWYTKYTVFGDMHVSELNPSEIKLDSLSSKGGNFKIDKDGNFKLDKFSVLGSGEQANGELSITNSGVKIDNLETPLGEVKLVFDFKRPALLGSIDISAPGKTKQGPREPIKLGAFMCRGQGSLLMDGSGFYLVASLQAQGELPPPIQGLQMGIAVGYRDNYESDAVVVLRGSSKDPLLPCKITETTGIHGFFMAGGVTVLHKEIGFDIVVAKTWANADVSLFASSEINVKNSLSVMFGAGAVASGSLGAAIFCASVSVDVLVLGDLQGTLSTADPKICMGATIAADFAAKIDACGALPGVDVSKTLAVKADVKWPGSPMFSFDFIEANGLLGKDCSIPILCNCKQ